MEKLELKHLAPYLPYRLKLIDHLYNKCNVAWMSAKKIAFIDTKGFGDVQKLSWDYTTNKIKPILRPISDITKEVEVNGKTFVPYIELLRECNFDVDNMDKVNIEFFKPNHEDMDINTKMFLEVQKLFEWHFDVFGLIEKGLAIDINTLKK